MSNVEGAENDCLFEMANSNLRCGATKTCAVLLVVDSSQAVEKGPTDRIVRVICGYFAYQRRLTFEDAVSEP